MLLASLLAGLGALLYLTLRCGADVEQQVEPVLEAEAGLELHYEVDVERVQAEQTWDAASTVRDRLIARAVGAGDDPGAIPQRVFDERRGQTTLHRDSASEVRLVVRGELARSISQLDDAVVAEWVGPDFTLDRRTEYSFTIRMRPVAAMKRQEAAMRQIIATIGARVQSLGVKGPDVRRAGATGIHVTLPGATAVQADQARRFLGGASRLAFRLLATDEDDPVGQAVEDVRTLCNPEGRPGVEVRRVDEYEAPLTVLEAARKSTLRACLRLVDAARAERGKAPLSDDEHVFGFEQRVDRDAGAAASPVWRAHRLLRRVLVGVETGEPRRVHVGGAQVARAGVETAEYGDPYVSLDFDPQGARDFGALTTAGVGRFLAIQVGDEVKSLPRIEEPITGGRARITLGRGSRVTSTAEAMALAAVLNAGAYQAPVHRVFDLEWSVGRTAPHFAGGTKLVVAHRGADAEAAAIREAAEQLVREAAAPVADVRIHPLSTDGTDGARRVQVLLPVRSLISEERRGELDRALRKAIAVEALELTVSTERLLLTLAEAAPVHATRAAITEVLRRLGHHGAVVTARVERGLDIDFHAEYQAGLEEHREAGVATPDDHLERALSAHARRKAELLATRTDRHYVVDLRSVAAQLERALAERLGPDRVSVLSAAVVGPSTQWAKEAPAAAGARWSRAAYAVLGGLVLVAGLLVLVLVRRRS